MIDQPSTRHSTNVNYPSAQFNILRSELMAVQSHSRAYQGAIAGLAHALEEAQGKVTEAEQRAAEAEERADLAEHALKRQRRRPVKAKKRAAKAERAAADLKTAAKDRVAVDDFVHAVEALTNQHRVVLQETAYSPSQSHEQDDTNATSNEQSDDGDDAATGSSATSDWEEEPRLEDVLQLRKDAAAFLVAVDQEALLNDLVNGGDWMQRTGWLFRGCGLRHSHVEALRGDHAQLTMEDLRQAEKHLLYLEEQAKALQKEMRR